MRPKRELSEGPDRELADRIANRNKPIRGKTEYELGLQRKRLGERKIAENKLREAQAPFKDPETEQKPLRF